MKNFILFGLLFMIVSCVTITDYRKLTIDEMKNDHICEVLLKKFKPTELAVALDYKGKTIYFCCSNCYEKFEKWNSRQSKNSSNNNTHHEHHH